MKSNKLHGLRRKSLVVSVAAASLLLTSGAWAQGSEELEEITVTGSRIRVTDGMAAPTPVTSMSTLELQNFEPGGTVAEQLDALPQFFATGSAQRGGATLFGDGPAVSG